MDTATHRRHRSSIVTEVPPAAGSVLYIISTINLQVSSAATMADMVRVAVNIALVTSGNQ